METLWAPWRMEYILGEKEEEGCIFCLKPQQDTDHKNLIIYRGKHCFIILNYYPYNNGHLMIVPFRHICALSQLRREEKVEIMNLIEVATVIIEDDMAAQGFNIGANIGKIAGAGIDQHLHFHVVPRWNGDTNFMPVTGHTKVIPEALEQIADRLRALFMKKLGSA